MTSHDGLQSDARPGRTRSLVLAAVVFAFLLPFTTWRVQSANDLSRLVAVEALAARGEFNISASPEAHRLEGTGDRQYRALIDMAYNDRSGLFYSSKPPVFSMILAVPAAIMHRLGVKMALVSRGSSVSIWLLTLCFVGLPTACAFYACRLDLGRRLSPSTADALTVLTLGGTLFLAYSSVMNHHTVTAALMLSAFFLLGMADARERISDGRAMAAGLLLGLASVTDVGPGSVFAMAMGLYVIFYLRSLRTLLLFGLAAVPPLAAHCIVQYRIWGNILPVQLLSGTKEYPLSYWYVTAGPDALEIPRGQYALLTLFGMRGLFTLSPILLIGLAGLVADIVDPLGAGRTGAERARWGRLLRPEGGPAYAAMAVLLAVLILVAYYGFTAPANFGGYCFGFRWYIGLAPFLAYYAARAWVRWRKLPRFRAIFVALAAVSMMYALIGLQKPWMNMDAYGHPAVQMLKAIRGY